MSAKLQEVALAIRNALVKWEGEQAEWVNCDELAVAAVSAMQEPSEEMVGAARWGNLRNAAENYRAMVRRVLE